jgi:hypothetical protein
MTTPADDPQPFMVSSGTFRADGRVKATLGVCDPDLPAGPLRDAVARIYEAVRPKTEHFADGSTRVRERWYGTRLLVIRCRRCSGREAHLAQVLLVHYTEDWRRATPSEQHPELLYVAQVPMSPSPAALAGKTRGYAPEGRALVRDLLDYEVPPGTPGHPPLRVGCEHGQGELARDLVCAAARAAQTRAGADPDFTPTVVRFPLRDDGAARHLPRPTAPVRYSQRPNIR